MGAKRNHRVTAGMAKSLKPRELGAVTDVDLPGRRLTLMCGHGERAMTAASLLARQGRTDTAVAIGGPDDWAAATGKTLGRT